jgi:anti-sigma-K factor RskA
VGRELIPGELAELLGAYALDAVDDDERRQIETWLTHDGSARAEIESLRETASLLGHLGDEAPAGLWARIEDALAVEPPRFELAMAPTTRIQDVDRRRGVGTRVAMGAAAAAIVLAVTLGVVLDRRMSDQGDRVDRLAATMHDDAMGRAAAASAADSEARVAMLTSSDGTEQAKIVTMPDGRGFLTEHNLPRLPVGRTYQLWALTGSPEQPLAVSVGVLGRRPSVVAFRAGVPVRGFALTDEAEPGVVISHQPQLLRGMVA